MDGLASEQRCGPAIGFGWADGGCRDRVMHGSWSYHGHIQVDGWLAYGASD